MRVDFPYLRCKRMHYAGEIAQYKARLFAPSVKKVWNDLSNRELILALPCILTNDADIWFDSIQYCINSFEDFKRKFKNRFIHDIDNEDLMNELWRRTQGKGKNISRFLSNILYIVTYFKKSPSEKPLLRIIVFREEIQSFIVSE